MHRRNRVNPNFNLCFPIVLRDRFGRWTKCAREFLGCKGPPFSRFEFNFGEESGILEGFGGMLSLLDGVAGEDEQVDCCFGEKVLDDYKVVVVAYDAWMVGWVFEVFAET